MRARSLSLFISLLFVLTISQLHAQGCSDGGLCSTGSLNILAYKFDYIPSDKKKLIKLDENGNPIITGSTEINNDSITPGPHLFVSISPKAYFQFITQYGIGERGISVITAQIEGNFMLVKEKLYAQIKLPYTWINGELGNVQGMSDPSLSITYSPIKDSRKSLNFTLGTKIPANHSDRSLDSLPLPMDYQTSLGSNDILLGSKFTFKRWDISIGYQHSFNATNNHYIHNAFVIEPADYNGYAESNQLKRSDDAVLRAGGSFGIKKAQVNAGILFIYHLTDDAITNALGERVNPLGSKGVTINLNAAGIIPITKKLDLVFIVAKPVLQRKYIPDGLGRSFVGIAGIKFSIY